MRLHVFPHFFASFHVRIYFIRCSVKTHFLTSLPSPSPEGFSAVLSASCGSVNEVSIQFIYPIEAYEMWRTEIRRSCELNAVQNLRDKSCAGAPRNGSTPEQRSARCTGAEKIRGTRVNPPPPRRSRRALHRAQQRQPWLSVE